MSVEDEDREASDEEPEEAVTLTRMPGPMFEDFIAIKPPKFLMDSEKEQLFDGVEEEILAKVKGSARKDRFLNSGNVEDHLVIGVPGVVFKPRAKALDKAVAAAEAFLKQQRYPVLVQEYDPKTRKVTELRRSARP